MTTVQGDADRGGDVEVLVEVSAVAGRRTGDLKRPASLAPVSFASRAGDIADTLLEVASQIRDRLQAADDAPAADGDTEANGKDWGLGEVQLNFQMALQADAGVVIAKASASTTFSATMIWRRGGPG